MSKLKRSTKSDRIIGRIIVLALGILFYLFVPDNADTGSEALNIVIGTIVVVAMFSVLIFLQEKFDFFGDRKE